MKARLVLARISAIVGSVLLLFPVVFTLVTSIPGSIMRGAFLMDFLLPAELGLLVLLGALLLLAGAILAKRQVRAVAVTLGLMVFTLVGGQLLAVVSAWLMETGSLEAPFSSLSSPPSSSMISLPCFWGL